MRRLTIMGLCRRCAAGCRLRDRCPVQGPVRPKWVLTIDNESGELGDDALPGGER